MQRKVKSRKNAMNNYLWKITVSLLLALTLPVSLVTQTLEPVVAQTRSRFFKLMISVQKMSQTFLPLDRLLLVFLHKFPLPKDICEQTIISNAAVGLLELCD